MKRVMYKERKSKREREGEKERERKLKQMRGVETDKVNQIEGGKIIMLN